jgi:protein-S-isoprenylcysteine O-methyltransferase Ste14
MVLALSGGAFRLWAFQTLGRHFTFELALLKNHELITKGPYAIVRHPSYTGLLALMWGTTVVIGSRGTWTREVVFADLIDAALGRGAGAWSTWSTWLRIFAGASIAGQLLTAAGMMARTKTEDRMLKREFGKRWDEWAKRTPWKLLPGLY